MDLDDQDVYTSDETRFASGATAQEVHRVSAPPAFVDLAGGDLRPHHGGGPSCAASTIVASHG